MFDPVTLRFFYANKGATEQVGYSMEELLDMTPLDIKPEFDESSFRAMVAPMLDGEYSAVNFETVHRHKDGHDVAVEIALQYVAPFNEPPRFIAIVRDISKRKQAEMELSRYRDRLEEMVQDRTIELKVINQELEAFAYSVSHDLRAPLRAIDGFSQALLEDYADRLDDQGRNYLNRVRAATQRMGHLIDDLLTLSRISRAVFNPQTVDLSNLANEIVQQLRDADPARRIETSVQEGLKVRGDWGLLKVTLENLLGNAWKYTGKGTAPRVDFGSLERDGEIIYYVRDNGVGFDMQHADKLFGAFQRLHHRDEFEGTGVGLATVKRIVNRHGGRIWAESEPSEQTTFYFTLPLGEAGEPNNVAKQTP
jgi:PAS domain S-box-containing protein